MELIKIRASTLTSYPGCARSSASSAFKDLIIDAGYELNQRRDGIGAIVGTSAHAGVEHSMREKMISGSPAKLKDCIDASIGEFDKLKRESNEILFDDTTKSVNDAHYQIEKIQRGHYAFIQPLLDPISVEERMFADLGDGFALSGQPDGIFSCGSIRDLKTGVRDTNYMAQLGGYSILARANGYKVNNLLLDYFPRTRPKAPIKPYSVEYSKHNSEFTAMRVINQIKRDYVAFEKTKNPWEFQANPSYSMCSSKFCPAHGTKFCEYTYKKPIKRSFIDE